MQNESNGTQTVEEQGEIRKDDNADANQPSAAVSCKAGAPNYRYREGMDLSGRRTHAFERL